MGKFRSAVVVLALVLGCGDEREVRSGMMPASAECECPLDLKIDNLAVCVSPTSSFGPAHVFSTHLAEGKPACEPWRDPQPVPRNAWTALRASSPCAGRAEFCVAVWAGDAAAQPDDCLVARVCSAFDYTLANQVLELPALSPWVAESSACAQRYEQQGGYLEFLTQSQELGCGLRDGRGRIVPLCPLACEANPAAPGCEICGNSPTIRL